MGNTDLRWKDLNENEAKALTETGLAPLVAARWARQAQALADTTRLSILNLIGQRGELCVSDLCLLTERGQSAVSRHLGILRDAGLIHSYRFDLWVYSALTPRGTQLFKALSSEPGA